MKTRRLLVSMATILVVLCMFAPVMLADDYEPATVVINGTPLKDANGNTIVGYLVNGRTMVPFRAIFEAFGAAVNYVSTDQPITASRGSQTISFILNSSEATLNGQRYVMPVPPMIINGRTMVPVRVTEVFGATFSWDGDTSTVYVTEQTTSASNSGQEIKTGKKHAGKISSGGETWLAADSPHIVEETLYVSGPNAPVLTIEAGAVVLFKEGRQLIIGQGEPGGLQVNGTAGKRVTFSAADNLSPQPGHWRGIWFDSQTLADKTIIQGADISYAGAPDQWQGAAISLRSDRALVEVTLNDVNISNSLFVAVCAHGNTRLSKNSDNLSISNTKSTPDGGGYPFLVTTFASDSLPRGSYTSNDYNSIRLWGDLAIKQDTVWRNLRIPYSIPDASAVGVNSENGPKLTIEPSTIVVFGKGSTIHIGTVGSGTLFADARLGTKTTNTSSDDTSALHDLIARDWKKWTADHSYTMDDYLVNMPILFAPSAKPEPGSWGGIRLGSGAGGSVFDGVGVLYGGINEDRHAGIIAEGSSITLKLANSWIEGSGRCGVQLMGEDVEFIAGSTNNVFRNNPIPLRVAPNAVGSIPQGQHFDSDDAIGVWNEAYSTDVAKTQTWLNHGVPYMVDAGVEVRGSLKPVLTIAPGTKLMFGHGRYLALGGGYRGQGSLVAVGSRDQKITFTSDLERPGAWEGLIFGQETGKAKIEYAIIEYARCDVQLWVDLGEFMKNTTIGRASEFGVWTPIGVKWTNYAIATLNNNFEGNKRDQQ